MNKFIFLFACLLSLTCSYGQKYFSKNAMVRFHSDSPIEKVEGTSSSGTTVIDVASGRIEFAVLNNSFVFEKALMQEHFNENYMESTKYPKSVFKGTINNISAVKFSVPGTYKITVTGEMSIHGVTKTITAPAEWVVDAKGLHSNSKFSVKCSDYNIEIPSIVRNDISNDIELTIKVDYNVLSQ